MQTLIPAPLRHAVLAAALATLVAGCASPPTGTDQAAKLQRIQTLVVIYAENHSFDNLYGLFPGANGISRATPGQMTQLDHDGKPNPAYPRMPND